LEYLRHYHFHLTDNPPSVAHMTTEGEAWVPDFALKQLGAK
jgi:hypothetical protein